MAKVAVGEKDQQTQRSDQNPKDPKILRHKDPSVGRIKVEELGAKDRLSMQSISQKRQKGSSSSHSNRCQGEKSYGDNGDGFH